MITYLIIKHKILDKNYNNMGQRMEEINMIKIYGLMVQNVKY